MEKEQIESKLEEYTLLKDNHQYSEAFSKLELLYQHVTSKEDELYSKIKHIQAQCKYQDKQISSTVRFNEAIKILDEAKDSAEKYKLKGAIYKRKYQLVKNIDDLYQAIYCYELKAKDIKEDRGYGACNAIFLYHTLLHDFGKHLDSDIIKIYNNKITQLRYDSLMYLESNECQKDEWTDVTISELYVSAKMYHKAKLYLNSNKENTRSKLITVEQIVRLHKYIEGKIDLNILLDLFQNYLEEKVLKNIVYSIETGKIGLALSGGGFRASFFHIGVLARLAELDILRKVEVISTVSGGSIIGMHYYLKLQQLLDKKDNNTIDKNDYIKLVQELEKEFFIAVKSNIRMKAFSTYENHVTKKVGELYQEAIYNNIELKDNRKVPTTMDEIKIYPQGYENKFNPHFHNWEITNKVPILILNSTVVNNGHNWRFTASGMGESQYMYDTTVDKNKINEFKRYEEFSDNRFVKVLIADAVATSSCVPGLFDPIEMDGLYDDSDEIIKLIDGGVYDNQGLSSLFDEECDVIICSDASGQFKDERNPSSCRIKLVQRVNEMLMDKTRDGEYRYSKKLLEQGKIKGLAILHLKQCFKESDNKLCDKANIYQDIDEDIQDKLSKIRTDLDSFNEIEAKSLVYSGYVISKNWIEALKDKEDIWNNFTSNKSLCLDFNNFKELMKNDKTKVSKVLDISQKKFFKLHCHLSSKCILDFIFVRVILITFNLLLFIPLTLIRPFYKRAFKDNIKRIFKQIAKFNLECINKQYIENGRIK